VRSLYKEDFFFYEKILVVIPESGKVMVQQQVDGLKPIAGKLEMAFPKFLETVAQDELARRAQERMIQEGFR